MPIAAVDGVLVRPVGTPSPRVVDDFGGQLVLAGRPHSGAWSSSHVSWSSPWTMACNARWFARCVSSRCGASQTGQAYPMPAGSGSVYLNPSHSASFRAASRLRRTVLRPRSAQRLSDDHYQGVLAVAVVVRNRLAVFEPEAPVELSRAAIVGPDLQLAGRQGLVGSPPHAAAARSRCPASAAGRTAGRCARAGSVVRHRSAMTSLRQRAGRRRRYRFGDERPRFAEIALQCRKRPWLWK